MSSYATDSLPIAAPTPSSATELMRNTGEQSDVTGAMGKWHATYPFLRALFWAVIATTLIMVGLPAALNAAALQ